MMVSSPVLLPRDLCQSQTNLIGTYAAMKSLYVYIGFQDIYIYVFPTMHRILMVWKARRECLQNRNDRLYLRVVGRVVRGV